MEQHHLKSESPIPAHRLSTPSTNKKSCLHVAGGKTNHPIPVIFTIGTFHLINSFSLFRRGNYENFSEKKNGYKRAECWWRDRFCVCMGGWRHLRSSLCSVTFLYYTYLRETDSRKNENPRSHSEKMGKWWKIKNEKKNDFPRTFAFHQMVLRFGGERRKQKSITKSQQRCKSISSSFKVWLSGVAATVNPLKLS